MINDEEALLLSIRDYVKANLNTEIVAINTEKNDSYSIDQITADNSNYIIAGETYELPNHMFVQVAFSGDIESETNKTGRLAKPTIVIEVAFDNAKKAGVYYKSLRYMRALYQVMVNYEPSAMEVDGLQITKLVPMVATRIGRELVVSGVEVSLAIG